MTDVRISFLRASQQNAVQWSVELMMPGTE